MYVQYWKEAVTKDKGEINSTNMLNWIRSFQKQKLDDPKVLEHINPNIHAHKKY